MVLVINGCGFNFLCLQMQVSDGDWKGIQLNLLPYSLYMWHMSSRVEDCSALRHVLVAMRNSYIKMTMSGARLFQTGVLSRWHLDVSTPKNSSVYAHILRSEHHRHQVQTASYYGKPFASSYKEQGFPQLLSCFEKVRPELEMLM